jgi:phosphotriesterase-related protein
VVDGGSYIGFDRIGILRLMPDETRADNLAKLVRDGFARQVMMSQDRHCGWLGKYQRQVSAEEQAEMDRLRPLGQWPPPYSYMFTDFIPMLHARGVTDADIALMLDENPRRFFAGEAIPG